MDKRIADITRRAIVMSSGNVTIGVNKSPVIDGYELRHRSSTHDYYAVTELPVWDDDALRRACRMNEDVIAAAIRSGKAKPRA